MDELTVHVPPHCTFRFSRVFFDRRSVEHCKRAISYAYECPNLNKKAIRDLYEYLVGEAENLKDASKIAEQFLNEVSKTGNGGLRDIRVADATLKAYRRYVTLSEFMRRKDAKFEILKT